MGIPPTRAHEAGEPRSGKDGRLWADGMWCLDSDLSWDRPLSDHLGHLCDLVEPRSPGLVQLSAEGYLMDFFCFVEVHRGNGGLLLEPYLLRRLAQLGVELDLDVYAAREQGELAAVARAR